VSFTYVQVAVDVLSVSPPLEYVTLAEETSMSSLPFVSFTVNVTLTAVVLSSVGSCAATEATASIVGAALETSAETVVVPVVPAKTIPEHSNSIDINNAILFIIFRV